MAMKRQPTRNVSISDQGVVQAVREPRHRMILELVRRMSRAAAPSDLVRLSGMSSEEVWRSVDALEAAWVAALARPEVKGRLEEQGFTVLARPSAQFGTEIRRYAETYAQVIRANNITVN
jgi:hypothetical protein